MLNFLRPTLYIQISPECVTVKNVKSGISIAEVPEMAINTGDKPTILAVGSLARLAAAAQGAQVINPFAHPRTMVSDFTTAELLLKSLVRQVMGRSPLMFAPTVVIHPLGSPAGGFTQVEYRAFREMALGAGGSQAFVWTGRVLTDAEVSSRSFPIADGQLGER
ncbi:rod shape-determining protein [Hydrogenophaga sp.]|uniref:rod shape-determining protein n=1 Tax=Hydrogenophaga sp. TaxID=1904254 RepID=UPI0027300B81|nr:rod shape-determining protein [Hydrogenophaga sp.]MDP2015617.1 rod shape-determining protein [Hydrogenophaga sp.]